MPVNKKKIAKNVLMLYIRMGIVLIVSLYTSRVVLQQLGASDYGLYNVVGGIIAMLNFMNGTLSSGVQRFYNVHKANDDNKALCKVFSSSIVIMAVFALILVVLAETVGLWFLNNKLNIPEDRMMVANWVYQLSIISAVASISSIPFSALYTAYEDFNIYAFLSIVLAVGNLGIAFLLKASSFDKLLFYSSMMCLLLLLYNFSIFIIAHKKYSKIRWVYHKEKEVYKSLLSFSGWNVLGVSMFMVMNQGVNMILNMFFGTIVNAARGIAFQIASKMEGFIVNIQTATNPQIVQLYARGETRALESLVDDKFRWNFSLYWLIALPVVVEINYILKIWLGDVPEYTAIFTVIIITQYLLRCFERPVVMLNFAVGDMKSINIFITIEVVITIALICFCFKMGFPPYWAFLWAVLYEAVGLFYKMLKARQYHIFSFRHFLKRIVFPVGVIILISFGCVYSISQFVPSGFLRLIISLIISTLLSSTLIYLLLLTKDNRVKVRSIIQKKLLRK